MAETTKSLATVFHRSCGTLRGRMIDNEARRRGIDIHESSFRTWTDLTNSQPETRFEARIEIINVYAARSDGAESTALSRSGEIEDAPAWTAELLLAAAHLGGVGDDLSVIAAAKEIAAATT